MRTTVPALIATLLLATCTAHAATAPTLASTFTRIANCLRASGAHVQKGSGWEATAYWRADRSRYVWFSLFDSTWGHPVRHAIGVTTSHEHTTAAQLRTLKRCTAR